VQARLADMDARIEGLDRKVSEQRDKVRKLIRAAVRMREPSELNLLLSAGRYHDSMIYQRAIRKLLSIVQGRIETVAMQKKRWENAKAKAVREGQILREDETEAALRLAETEKLLEKKKRRLKERQDSIAAVSTLFMLGTLDDSTGQAPSREPVGASEFADLKSRRQLKLPISPGRIAKQYDRAPMDDLGTEKMARGWIITPYVEKGRPMPEKAAVRAVFDGAAVWLGEIPGFGMTLVLRHGPIHHSVYANLYKLYIAKGAQVKAADEIGMVKSLRKGSPPYLYFEVREDRAAVDPKGWFRLRPMK
jgi:septal ring factor EnvC (AmiA/AmiB activator)